MNLLLRIILRLNRSMAVCLSFLALIGTGTLLLMLPCANNNGQWMPFIDALFTAASASCVTGLAVVDTGTYFSLFGQLVLLALIQIGGVGIMTLTAMLSIGLGKRVAIRERLLLQESLNQEAPGGVVQLVMVIVKYTLAIELLFGALLSFYFYEEAGMGLKAFYWGYWHAVSAFCNAGFDLLGDWASLTSYRDNPVVNIIFMLLITLGGLGFAVISDVLRRRRWRAFSLHTKIVLASSLMLSVGGALVIWLLEMDNPQTLGGMSTDRQLMAALFQSVSLRTAGFNTVDISAMGQDSLFFMALLMLVGASPTSTGGGLKTTTIVVLFVSTLALVRNKKDAVLFRRRISRQTIDKAASVFVLALLWLGLAFFLLLSLNGGRQPFQLVLFEVFSAFGTVGMGTGITPGWSVPAKLVLIVTMFIGRVGILTFIMSFFDKPAEKLRYPAEDVFIG